MSDKIAENAPNQWFWQNASGAKSGPVDLKAMREKVLSGEVTAQTLVSADGQSWKAAVACPELGFDCIVLEVGESLNVLGPFAKEHLDRLDGMSEVPADGILFVRGGTVKESVPGKVSGTTGAALVERVLAAEKSFKESEKARREAESSLAAKDLEFDAERQKLNGLVSGFKAAELKMKSEIDALRSDIASRGSDDSRRNELEARLVDAENLLSTAQAATAKANGETETVKKSVQAILKEKAELETKLANSAKQIDWRDSKYAELEKRLAETGRQITEREGRCVELEGGLADARDTVSTLKKQVSDSEAQLAELVARLQASEKAAKSFDDAGSWFHAKLTELARDVAEKFGDESAEATDGPRSSEAAEDFVVEAVDPEVVEKRDDHSDGVVRLRKVSVSDGAPNIEKLSALENQLKREISSLGAAKGSGNTGHDGLIGVFKRRK